MRFLFSSTTTLSRAPTSSGAVLSSLLRFTVRRFLALLFKVKDINEAIALAKRFELRP
jgi:hypothetical protein